MEDGEINDGFLGEVEMENRKALAGAHGEGAGMSWVEAVLLGAGQVTAADAAATKDVDIEQQPEGRPAVSGRSRLAACLSGSTAVQQQRMIAETTGGSPLSIHLVEPMRSRYGVSEYTQTCQVVGTAFSGGCQQINKNNHQFRSPLPVQQ